MITLIRNAYIINEGRIIKGDVLIEADKISSVSATPITAFADEIIDATNLYLLPGCIDDQVHFREPGLTYKADIYSESRAAVAGGVTSYMEMPNTVPNTLTQELLAAKYAIAAATSLANYSFYMGASNDNIEEVLKTDPHMVCGVKVFMGSSTGNMLVDNKRTLETLFSQCNLLIATHCEDEAIIRANVGKYIALYGENLSAAQHPLIRSAEACYASSSLAVELAKKYNTRLHVLHISTAKEIELFEGTIPLKEKRITAEACIHHLWFSANDYETKGNLIKWNPAIKSIADRDAILAAVIANKIDVIATDHAPHTLEEKLQAYIKAPSGGPLVQHALLAMLELYQQGKITLEKIVEKMSHLVADCFQLENRGYIREGYYADLVLVDLTTTTTVNKSNLLYKCAWSPFEGSTFRAAITHTFVNGNNVFCKGKFKDAVKGLRLTFNRE